MPVKTAKKRKRNPLVIIAIIIVLLLAFLFIANRLGWIGGSEATSVSFATAEQRTIIERVSASGTVQPEIEVKISPEVPGEITELNIEEGDSVQQDQLLIRIRPDNFESALSRVQANLNQQRATAAQMQAQVSSAEAQLVQAEAAYERNKKLYEDKVISPADFEQAESNYQVALQGVESAKQNAQAAQYAVRSADAAVDEARENLSLTNIYAPVGGIVSKLDVEKGERVVGTSQMAGTELLRIADLNQMEVRVDVNENDIVRVNIGDTAEVEVDAYSYRDTNFKGVVTAIANTANAKATPEAVTEFEVRIRLLNASYQNLLDEKNTYPFRPGMTASVDIITQRKNGVLSVPLAAVTTRPNASAGDTTQTQNEETFGSAENMNEVVFRKKADNTVEKVVVKTGISDYEHIEITQGLAAGDEVVSGPYIAISSQLNDGDLVKKAEDNPQRPEQ